MKDKIAISVVIPHYNIPDLLVRALRSIPQREDVQVIVVDDGSDSDIADFVERFKKEDCQLDAFRENIEFYPQPHCGLAGRMRNIGMNHAKGEWFTFLDADDFFMVDADRIFTEVQRYEEDIVFYNSKAVMSDDLTKKSSRAVYSGIFEMEPTDERESIFRYTFHSLWGKFIRRELIDSYKLQFDETPYGNDVYFSISAGVYAQSVRIERDVIYVVTEREGSITTETHGTKERRLKECRVRYGVAYRTHCLLKENKVNLPVEYDPLVNAVGAFRLRYKKDYYKILTKLLFLYPACTGYYLKKDFRYLFLGVRNPSLTK